MITKLEENNTVKIKELERNFPKVFKNGAIKKDFKENPYTNYLIYEVNNKIIGFINYYLIYERLEIVNFNVLESFQNQKIGSKLMDAFFKIAKDKNIKNITLEVRKDNEKALHIYQKYGFREVAIRKKYYQGIDGILMEKEMM